MLARKFFSVVLAVIAIFLIAMGARLLLMGGSLYYALIGLVYADTNDNDLASAIHGISDR